MAIIGYVRVSTQEQNIERQLVALEGCERIYTDRLSGKDTERPELQRMINDVQAGDTVRIKSVDRLARNTKDLLTLLDSLLEKNVSVFFIDTNMTFSNNPVSKFMITMLGAVGELERGFINQRQAEGIALAKDRGVYKGRPGDGSTTRNVKRYKAEGMTQQAVSDVLGIGIATVKRHWNRAV
ncbi:DNA invertase Pin [Kosakonia radicincitans]|uniref:recombinase family protein n=1 Tax=Kosakonia radicincitans TaxID=283686 RepID=UPI000903146F|nr:recombinase family protein [Kosakonia radicincitans]APG18850.1 DNA invertase Pin [Kosakonia radicincitans]